MQRSRPLILAVLCTSTALSSAEIVHRPGKLPVIVPTAEVTINGEPRPDLGRAISDSIAGGLLRTGAFTVIDMPANDAASATAEPSTEAIPETTSAHYAFIPRLIVEEDYYKLSVKKRRISDNELVQIYEKSEISPHRSTMFELLDDTLRLIYSDISRDRARDAKAQRTAEVLAPGAGLELDPSPVRSEPAESPKPVPTPAPRERKTPPTATAKGKTIPSIVRPLPSVLNRAKPSPGAMVASATKPFSPKSGDVSGAKEATEIAEYAGRIRAVNAEWDFCVIEVAKRGMLKVKDELLVRSSASLEPLGKLRITKVEGSQVVADPASSLSIRLLRPGYKVYRWSKAE